MKLSEAAALFVAEVAGWKMNETPKAYQNKLRRLSALNDMDLNDITLADLNRIKTDMLSTHSPYTVKSTFTTVKHFFKWAYASGLTGTNPALSLRIPPPPPPNPKPISEDTFEKLFDAAKVYGDDLERARNVALLAVLRDTGGRVSGITSLEMDALDLRRGLATVIEKSKSRALYLNAPAITALERWLAVRDEMDHSVNTVFYSFTTGKALTRSGVEHILNTLARHAGVTARHNPHSFRHAFARDCLQAGADLSQVSQLMGHSRITITADYYARWDDRELKKTHRKVSPGRKIKL